MARGPQRAYRPARGGVAYRAPVAEREDVLQQGARQREQATARFGFVILADQMTRAGGVNLLGVAAQPWLARECDDAASGRGGRAEAPPSHLELAPSRVGAYRHGWQRSLHTISDVRDLRVSTEGAVINPTHHKFGERRADKNFATPSGVVFTTARACRSVSVRSDRCSRTTEGWADQETHGVHDECA